MLAMIIIDQSQEAFEDLLLAGKETTDDPTLNFLTDKYRLARGEFDAVMANIDECRLQLTRMQSQSLVLEGEVNCRIADVREWARAHGVVPTVPKVDEPTQEEGEEGCLSLSPKQ